MLIRKVWKQIMGIVEPILKVEGISKHFSGTQALKDVSFELLPGEVHALMGENGAGKSTLGKIIAAIYPQDEGKIYFKGKEVNFVNTRQSRDAGIAIVLQEFNLFPHLSVAENLFLIEDSMYKYKAISDKKHMVKKTFELLRLFSLQDMVDPYERISNLSVAQMQIIEILKAVYAEASVIILDEPTASLSPNEVKRLFTIMRDLKSRGVAFILVSHKINEIYEISDRITVLRDGKLILQNIDTPSIPENALVHSMVGREITDLYSVEAVYEQFKDPKNVLEVEGLCDEYNYVKDAGFCVKEGEIVAISGLIGAGRSQLVRCIFGADSYSSGRVKINGKTIAKNNIRASMRAGIGYVPENRKEEGLLQDLMIIHNLSLPSHIISRGYYVNDIKEKKRGDGIIEQLGIKVNNINNPVNSLSGGNQQKVLLAKWLLLNLKLLIIDEPTRGIDIAAKSDIYTILKQLASKGMAILMVSSEIPEVLGISDRILVMRNGKIVAELDQREATDNLLGKYAALDNK